MALTWYDFPQFCCCFVVNAVAVAQITKEGIKGVFKGVLTDFGDRMSSDGMSTLGTISFQQFKPHDLKASMCHFDGCCHVVVVAVCFCELCLCQRTSH